MESREVQKYRGQSRGVPIYVETEGKILESVIFIYISDELEETNKQQTITLGYFICRNITCLNKY